MAATYNLEVEQIDFIGAFLNSNLTKDIYIESPAGLEELFEARPKLRAVAARGGYKPSTKQIIKLNKALYGLKQSPREWQIALRALL